MKQLDKDEFDSGLKLLKATLWRGEEESNMGRKSRKNRQLVALLVLVDQPMPAFPLKVIATATKMLSI